MDLVQFQLPGSISSEAGETRETTNHNGSQFPQILKRPFLVELMEVTLISPRCQPIEPKKYLHSSRDSSAEVT